MSSGIDEAEIKQIEEFLKSIPDEFHDKDLNVLKKVVKVITSQSRQKDIRNMEHQLQQVEHILFKIVDESYQELLSSIQAYSNIVEKVQNNKSQVNVLQDQIKSTTNLLNQNVSHIAKWNLASQYREMVQILDSIAWLKTVPPLMEIYIPDLKQSILLLSQSSANSFHLPSSNLILQKHHHNANEINNYHYSKAYLHASLLLLSAQIILKSSSPKVREGELPIIQCKEKTIKLSEHGNLSPLSQIPAVAPLRTYILSIYEVCFKSK